MRKVHLAIYEIFGAQIMWKFVAVGAFEVFACGSI